MITTETTTYTAGERAGTTVTDKFGGSLGTIQSESVKRPDGSNVNSVFDATGGKIVTMTSADGTARVEKYSKGGGGADVLTSVTIQSTHPNGTVATQTLDPTTGKPTGLTLKDSKGNVTAALPDGKGGFTSAVAGEHGKVTTSSYDADGKLTGETIRDKKGKVLSTTSVTSDGKGGSTSVTTDKHGKVTSSKVYDSSGNVVSQTGKKQIMSLGTRAQSSGGTQTSQGSGKHKDKQNFQTEVFHQNKEKSNVQDSGSSGTSSGSGNTHHHRRH